MDKQDWHLAGPVKLILAVLAVLALFSFPTTVLAAGECSQCHGDNVAAGHHQSTAYEQGLCTQCHEGVTTSGDCAQCHTFVPQQNKHHDTASATSGDCAQCHTDVGNLADCLSCHQGQIRTPHHTAAADPAAPIDCASCHTNMEPLAGCLSCHSGNIRDQHHIVAADPSAPLDCASCHTAIQPVTGCESCHDAAYWVGKGGVGASAQSTHHSNASTNNTPCASCHTDAQAPSDCHQCHQGEATDAHHQIASNVSIDCSVCHSQISVDIYADDAAGNPMFGCQDCHTPGLPNRTKHHDMALADNSLTCATCHADAGPVPGCATCHDASYWGVDTAGNPVTPRDKHHEIAVANAVDCSSCHTTIVYDQSCNSCHVKGDARQAHHDMVQFGMDCGICHGAQADVNNCETCHTATTWSAGNAADQHHDVIRVDQSLDCSVCHETLDPKESCTACHDAGFWTAGNALLQHHDDIRFNNVTGAEISCSSCHGPIGGDETASCESCHTSAPRAAHHAQLSGPVPPTCQECHADLPVVSDCESCHTSATWTADARADHHAFAAGDMANCASCHATIDPKADCFACHDASFWTAGSALNQHHDLVSPTLNNDCSQCHTSMSPVANCDGCHAKGEARDGHHDYATQIGIDCGFCHGAQADVANCESCHTPATWTAGSAESQHHDVIRIGQTLDCSVCHVTIDPKANCQACHDGNWTEGTAQLQHHNDIRFNNVSGAEISCSSCHGSIPGDETATCESCHVDAPREAHHAQLDLPEPPTCQQCHVDLPVVSSCADCHQGDSASAHHVTVRNDYPEFNDCATCHTTIVPVVNCETCHTPSNWTAGANAQEAHHNLANSNQRSCNECHESIAPAGDCSTCHANSWPAGAPNLHHESSTSANFGFSCLDCHVLGATGIEKPGPAQCESCHTQTIAQTTVPALHHATAQYAANDCAACHGGIGGISPESLDCATCHAGKTRDGLSLDGTPTMHHLNPAFSDPLQQNCTLCHQGVDASALDCAACHADKPRNGSPQMHHTTTLVDANVCANCHTNIVVAGCESCHASEPVLNGSPTMHHTTTKVDASVCVNCHTGAETASNNCQLCHVDQGSARVGNSQTHHATPIYASGTCASCHTGLEATPAGLDCATCHADVASRGLSSKDGSSAMHHNNPAAQPTTENCALCHDALSYEQLLAADSCRSCHTGTVGTDPMTISKRHHEVSPAGQAGNCNLCHVGGTDAVDNCALCHNGTVAAAGDNLTHHATATATAGSCVACHSGIPAASLDCATCHADKARNGQSLDGSSAMHHLNPAFSDPASENCALCHLNVTLGGGCESCHASLPDKSGSPQMHHTTSLVDPTVCATCHAGAAAAVNNCELCHDGNVGRVGTSATHHLTGGYASGNCASCHTGLEATPAGLDCATCHADVASRGLSSKDGSSAMHHNNPAYQPATENCALCHDALTFEQLNAGGNCRTCHTNATQGVSIESRHHGTTAALADNCALCHTVDQAQLDCASCHASQSKDGKGAMHHATDPALAGNCTDCHASVDATNLNCGSCHATLPAAKSGGLDTHHNGSQPLYAAGTCTACHIGAETELLDCAGCHISANAEPMGPRHHDTVYAVENGCAACHTDVNQAELDCALCHTKDGMPAIETQHHDMTIAGQTGQCTVCHVGADVAEGDCASCHDGATAPAGTSATHHLTTTYQTGICSTCHVGAEIAASNVCATCHTAGNHHLSSTQYAADNCTFCHSSIQLTGANCADCHTSTTQTIPEMHHATPLTSVGGDCSVCHQAVSSPTTCSACHASTPHHDSNHAVYGVCEQCHTWPADKDENPQQAACRQCHGEYVHGKNSAAPIHDYRACFDCHASNGSMATMFPLANPVLPYHAMPAQGVGLTNPAPGKGSFNIGYNIIGGKSRSNYTDRFGDQEQWERMDRTIYASPAISYTQVSISEGGRTYQVPGFDNIPMPNLPTDGGGTTPPGGNGLESCTSCHADYGSLVSCDNQVWRDHLNARVDLATYQLAETTYIGNLCPDQPTEPPVTDVNLALNKSISASLADYGYSASNANDGDMNTRWRASDRSTRTLTVDLGSRMDVSRVVVAWHSDYATDYRIRYSNDNYNWSEAVRNSSGNGGSDELTFNTVNARYIQLYCSNARYNYYSVYEFEVYGSGGSDGGGSTPPSIGNLAASASATATRDNSEAANTIDGNLSTSWKVSAYDRESVYLDLGSQKTVGRVVIRWDNQDYAREYRVELSNDNNNWTRVVDESSGDGGTTSHSFSPRSARYIEIECRQRNDNEYEIFEIEVYAQ